MTTYTVPYRQTWKVKNVLAQEGDLLDKDSPLLLIQTLEGKTYTVLSESKGQLTAISKPGTLLENQAPAYSLKIRNEMGLTLTSKNLASQPSNNTPPQQSSPTKAEQPASQASQQPKEDKTPSQPNYLKWGVFISGASLVLTAVVGLVTFQLNKTTPIAIQPIGGLGTPQPPSDHPGMDSHPGNPPQLRHQAFLEHLHLLKGRQELEIENPPTDIRHPTLYTPTGQNPDPGIFEGVAIVSPQGTPILALENNQILVNRTHVFEFSSHCTAKLNSDIDGLASYKVNITDLFAGTQVTREFGCIDTEIHTHLSFDTFSRIVDKPTLTFIESTPYYNVNGTYEPVAYTNIFERQPLSSDDGRVCQAPGEDFIIKRREISLSITGTITVIQEWEETGQAYAIIPYHDSFPQGCREANTEQEHRLLQAAADNIQPVLGIGYPENLNAR